MKKIGGIFLAVLAFFSSTLEVFAETIEVFEEKTETINKEDFNNYKQGVENKVISLNESDDEYVYDYEITITEEKNEVVIEETKKVSSKEKFTSEEDAKKFYEEYKLEEVWKKGDLKITTEKENVTVNGDTITISCKEETCTDEITALESALNEFQKIEIIKKETTSKEDTKTVIYSVDGKEQELSFFEAQKILKTLNPELEGYTFIKNEMFLSRKGSADIKTYQDLYGNKKFETEEEANKALQEFLARTDYDKKSGIVIAILDEEETKIEDYVLGGFITEELAKEAALAEIKLSLDGVTIIMSKPYQKYEKDIKEIKDMEFKTTEEALKYIAEQALKGYIASDVDIKEISGETTGKVETGVKITPQKYVPLTATKLSDYVIVKKGNKSVAVWTKDQEWSKEQQEEFKKSINKVDTSINENTEFVFIHGYKTFDLSYLGNEWGKAYNFSTNKLGLIVVTPEEKNDISYIVTGTVEYGEQKVLLNCTLTKETNLWYVDMQKTTLGYDYVITGTASTIVTDLFKVKSNFVGTIYNHSLTYKINTTNNYTSYIASFDTYKEVEQTKATVSYKITREKAATGTVIPDEEETLTPPITGAEVSIAFQNIVLIALLGTALLLKKQCK